MLHTIVGCSYGECPYAEIAEKLEKIYHSNKVWCSRKSNTGAIPSQCNPLTTQPQMRFVKDGSDRTEFKFVLKYITGGTKKINAVNYLSKPPPPNYKCYYAEDSYAVNLQTGGFRTSDQGSNQENWR